MLIDHLFIAEKPSLAAEIARVRGIQTGNNVVSVRGYFTVGNDAVVGLFGHMYELAPPEVYSSSYKTWRMDHLPIIPEVWKRVFQKTARDRINLVNSLIPTAKFIVNAGDAAREGQLLVDEVLVEASIDPFGPNVKRIWVRSMAQKDMLAALEGMQANSEKRTLFEAAYARQRADWLLGMNMSRCYTLKARSGGADINVAVGRVMTPTLKLVVDRDREIENFRAVDYYIPTLSFEHAGGTFQANWVPNEATAPLDAEGRLLDASFARKIAEGLVGRHGKVRTFKVTKESKSAPLPYSLSALQIACSAKFSMTAKQTLDAAQELYEKYKLTTYPRTDSRYLPMAIFSDEAPTIMRGIESMPGYEKIAQGADMSIRSAAWNDAKVSDHHAIIPTQIVGSSEVNLSPETRQVFDLIVRSFLAQFYPPYRYEKILAQLSIESELFEARGRKPIDAGWHAAFAQVDEDEDAASETAILPTMSAGDPVKAVSFQVQSKRTQPPARFTDGTLIDAMTNVHRFVSDPNIKKHLREKDGLGTEATRGGIIEKLLITNSLVRKAKKFIQSTEVGTAIIDYVPFEIQDPGMTALWEGALEKIVEGLLTEEEFMAAQVRVLTKRIEEAKASHAEMKGVMPSPLSGHGGICPGCSLGKLITRVVRKGKYTGKRYLRCERAECEHMSDFEGAVKYEPLPGDGTPCTTCNVGKLVTRGISKGDQKGKRFLSCSTYPKCNHAVFEARPTPPPPPPLPGHGGKCPSCTDGKLMTRRAAKGPKKGSVFLACTGFPACRHVVSSENVKSSAQKIGTTTSRTKEDA